MAKKNIIRTIIRILIYFILGCIGVLASCYGIDNVVNSDKLSLWYLFPAILGAWGALFAGVAIHYEIHKDD